MDLKYTSCFYHPDRVAITICEACHKPICLEDKRVIQFNPRSFNRNSDFGSHDFCGLCYVELKQKSSFMNPLWIVLPFLIAFMFLFLGILAIMEFDRFLIGFFVVFFGLAIFMVITVFGLFNPNKKPQITPLDFELANELKQLKSYSSKTSFSNQQSTFKESEELSKNKILQSQLDSGNNCPSCGFTVTSDDKFCPNCGLQLF